MYSEYFECFLVVLEEVVCDVEESTSVYSEYFECFLVVLEQVVGNVVDGLPGGRSSVHVADFAQTCDHFLFGQEVGQTELYPLLVGVLDRAWRRDVFIMDTHVKL